MLIVSHGESKNYSPNKNQKGDPECYNKLHLMVRLTFLRSWECRYIPSFAITPHPMDFLGFHLWVKKKWLLLDRIIWNHITDYFSKSFSNLRFNQIWFSCFSFFLYLFGSVGWGGRIHRLHLCRGVRPPPPNEYPRYDTKQSDGEVPVMLGLWGIRSTPSLPLLPGILYPGVVASDRALSMGLIELNYTLMRNWIV